MVFVPPFLHASISPSLLPSFLLPSLLLLSSVSALHPILCSFLSFLLLLPLPHFLFLNSFPSDSHSLIYTPLFMYIHSYVYPTSCMYNICAHRIAVPHHFLPLPPVSLLHLHTTSSTLPSLLTFPPLTIYFSFPLIPPTPLRCVTSV